MADGESSIHSKIRKKADDDDGGAEEGQEKSVGGEKSAKSKKTPKSKKDSQGDDGEKSSKSKTKKSRRESESKINQPPGGTVETARSTEVENKGENLNLDIGHNESIKVPQLSMKSVMSMNKQPSNTASLFKQSLNNERSLSELEGINEIRKKREEERVKDMHFFRNQKQAQIAKAMEIRKQELLKEQAKEHKRKRRHDFLKKQVVDFKQCQTERRRSIDKQYSDFITEKTKKRQNEIHNFLKTRHEEYTATFKKDLEDFKKREKEKLKKKQIQERGWARAKDKDAQNGKLIENWEEVKMARATDAKVQSLFNTSVIHDIFNSFNTELIGVYEYYSAINLDPFAQKLSGWGGGGALPYRNFFAFVNQVGLMPSIIEVPEFKALYRTVTKGLLINKTIPTGLSLEQFKEILFRIVLKRKDFFAKVNPPDETKKKYINIEYVDIFDEAFHSYNDIKDVQDEYNDIDNFHYTHLDGLFHFLALPNDHQELVNYLESLRKAFHKAKPASIKRLPKKIEYEKLHKVNEKVRSQIEKLYGPSDYKQRQDAIKAAKQKIERDRRNWGLKNKRAMSSKRLNTEGSDAEMTGQPQF